ncbi:MAG TPA: serine protease [Solirubrobacteraceae bacterium]|jgi:secreted trypsin-like serine protease
MRHIAGRARRLAVVTVLLAGGALLAGPSEAVHALRVNARIVGGDGAPIERFPFQVALYERGAASPATGFFCGGVILDATQVATAAHCLVESGSGRLTPPRQIAVLAGSTRLAPPEPGSVEDDVAATAIDPEYEPQTNDFDVGLVTLAKPLWQGPRPQVTLGARIAPLSVRRSLAAVDADPLLEAPVIATVSGWGETSPMPGGGANYPDELRSVQVPLVTSEACQQDYNAIEQAITPRMLCAGGGSPSADACYGDSGGPLVVDADNPANPPEDYVLAGIVTFGDGCGQAGFPGVYTRIADPAIANFLTYGPAQDSAREAGAGTGEARRCRRRRAGHRHRRSAHLRCRV